MAEGAHPSLSVAQTELGDEEERVRAMHPFPPERALVPGRALSGEVNPPLAVTKELRERHRGESEIAWHAGLSDTRIVEIHDPTVRERSRLPGALRPPPYFWLAG